MGDEYEICRFQMGNGRPDPVSAVTLYPLYPDPVSVSGRPDPVSVRQHW